MKRTTRNFLNYYKGPIVCYVDSLNYNLLNLNQYNKYISVRIIYPVIAEGEVIDLKIENNELWTKAKSALVERNPLTFKVKEDYVGCPTVESMY